MRHTVNVKPLSVNQAWKGRRYKTDKYKKYEQDIMSLLPQTKPLNGDLSISFEFGFSNASSDLDNPVKPLLDIMQKKYGFNDKQVVELNIKKTKTCKGREYIKFEINVVKKV